ncbi:MAG: hypothetical protein ABIJ57_09410 [Pseudomonadota bacterium]|uniref:Uncharacterized protein n=1 Tax=viral metagenome TaxID=1070528 RepID=A0A6M3J675_9ZZZZ
MSNPVSLKLKETERLTFAFMAADTVNTYNLDVQGMLRMIILELPDFTTGSPTCTVQIKNKKSLVVWSVAGLAENTQHNLLIEDGLCPVGVDSDLVLTLSGAAGGTNLAFVTLFLR